MPRPLAALAALFAIVIAVAAAMLYVADRRAVQEVAEGGPNPAPEDTPAGISESAPVPAEAEIVVESPGDLGEVEVAEGDAELADEAAEPAEPGESMPLPGQLAAVAPDAVPTAIPAGPMPEISAPESEAAAGEPVELPQQPLESGVARPAGEPGPAQSNEPSAQAPGGEVSALPGGTPTGSEPQTLGNNLGHSGSAADRGRDVGWELSSSRSTKRRRPCRLACACTGDRNRGDRTRCAALGQRIGGACRGAGRRTGCAPAGNTR
jgi:hypothetical protein